MADSKANDDPKTVRLGIEDVQAQIAARRADIDRRIDGIGAEVSNLGGAVWEAVLKNPIVSVGGAVVAGTLVGLLVGGRRDEDEPHPHRDLVDRYLDAVADEARYLSAKGQEAGEATRAALRERVPLIVYEQPPQRQSGFFAELLDLTYKTAIGFAVKALIDYATGQIDLDELVVPDEEPDAPARAGDVAPVAAAPSVPPTSASSA